MKPRRNSWTEKEIDYIRANFGKLSCPEMMRRLPGRTLGAIANIASREGFSKRKSKPTLSPSGGGPEKAPGLSSTPPAPIPVPVAMLRLAEFDPVVRRAVEDRRAGRSNAA